MKKVIITVSGGLVTGAYANDGNIEVEVIDYDNINEDTENNDIDHLESLETELQAMSDVLKG